MTRRVRRLRFSQFETPWRSEAHRGQASLRLTICCIGNTPSLYPTAPTHLGPVAWTSFFQHEVSERAFDLVQSCNARTTEQKYAFPGCLLNTIALSFVTGRHTSLAPSRCAAAWCCVSLCQVGPSWVKVFFGFLSFKLARLPRLP